MSKITHNVILNSAITTFILIAIIGSLFVIPSFNVVEQKQHRKVTSKLSTTLKVDLYDSNMVLKQSVVKEDDLLTKQFIDVLASFFASYSNSADYTIVLKNDAGTDKTFTTSITDNSLTNTISDSATGSASKGGFIGIGTGSTAPARADYSLTTKVESYTKINTNYPSWHSASGNISIPSTIAITGNRSLREACLGVWWIDNAGVLQNIVMAHDVYNLVSAINGDFVTITYVIHLHDTAFMDNFGYFLSAMFGICVDGGYVYISGNQISGASVGNYAFYTTTYQYALFNRITPSVSTNGVRIGTGTTAVARTQYTLVTPVELVCDTYVTANSTGFTILSSVFCTSDRNITELYITRYGISISVMWVRMKFDAVSIDAGTSCDIELRVEC